VSIIAVILVIAAVVLFAIEAWWHKNLVALGLALFVIAWAIVTGFPKL
jgi:hypothetical protein